MLEEYLSTKDCATCKICCKFEPDEICDAPTFTEEEMLLSKKVNCNAEFIKKGAVYQLVLEKWNNKYICPFLSENGCLLCDNRPFDCKSWPFYLMKQRDNYVLTLTKDCPVVWDRFMNDKSSIMTSNLISECKRIIEYYPDMIPMYNRNMTIVYTFS